MDRLEPVIFNDAWGSNVSIASLQGRPIPSDLPESELWMGAHESGPSGVTRGRYRHLAEAIAADPEAELGARCVERFGPRLPFLLKVLAPGRAISIQAHPSATQAIEERARTGDAVYVDDWAKPELLLAISPFEVFVGLRPWEDTVAFCAALRVRTLDRLVEDASASSDPVPALLRLILEIPEAEVPLLVRQVVAAAVRVEALDNAHGKQAAAIVRVAEEHPDDIGVAVIVLMDHRLLHPGEFIDVAAGVLHSYVRGLGIEVLANSDNVVRAGLTSKEVNVPELLRIVDPTAKGVPGGPRAVGPGLHLFRSASDRFRLYRVDATRARELPGEGSPRIVFTVQGDIQLRTSGDELTLGPVESAFIGANESGLTIGGDGQAYLVCVPD